MTNPRVPSGAGATPDPRQRNTLWARTLLDALAQSGVRQVIVAPGSRSTPLVLAVAADPRFETAVQVDERSAGFLGLGVGKATGLPAAVITTSGTAVANLLPAVVEASQSSTPLLLLTADRPPRLRGADANQAIVQPGIFGGYLRFEAELSPAEVSDRTLRHLRSVAARAVAAAVGDPAGPVHLNLPFEKPLEPSIRASPGHASPDEASPGQGWEDTKPGSSIRADADAATSTPRIHPIRALPPEEVLEGLATALEEARTPLLVAGPLPRPWETGPALASLARRLGVPLLADPLSGARPGAWDPGKAAPGVAYDLLLRGSTGQGSPSDAPEGGPVRSSLLPEPDLILRFGATPSSAALAAWLLERAHIPQVVVDAGGRWKDHLAVAAEVIPGDPTRVARWLETARRTPPRAETAAFSEAWATADAMVVRAVRPLLAGAAPLAEGAAAVACARHAVDRGALLFVSNSMPIRDLDALWPVGAPAPPDEAGSPDAATEPFLPAYGNRGASGIDGIASTALGVAWGSGRRVVALLGDLALLHDMNGLLRASGSGGVGSPRLKVDFVVVNNDGGGIFHLLPVRDHEPHFTPFVATPHGLEPARVAALHGLPFRRIEGRRTEARRSERPQIEGRRIEAQQAGPAEPLQLQATLDEALAWAESQPGSTLVELRTDRHENHLAHDALTAAVADPSGEGAYPSHPRTDPLPHAP
jgi:2-succinyl-5-enolpyruvyl-6-hydroxy-3-cyclohexene-1-carboxylate synthase